MKKGSNPTEDAGTITVTFASKTVLSKIVNLSSVYVSFTEGEDLFGDSEPFVVAKIGGWSARTETGDSQRLTFKKGLELKFSTEDTVILEVWDEDVTTD